MPGLSNFKDNHGVKWLPPWSLVARQQWSESHPWLAGFFFGLIMAIYIGIFAAILTPGRIGVMVGLATWLVLWPLFAVAVKRRWWQRPDGQNVDLASALRRPWIRLSDRMLSLYIWLFAFSTIVSVFGVVLGSARVSAAFTLSVSLVLLATTWVERKRRRTEP